MTLRVCAEPGCPTLGDRARCKVHERAKDAARGTRRERGYDAAYDATRRGYERRQATGETFTCWRCLKVITHTWQLGHCDDDRTVIHGPEHPGCNLATSGRMSVACPHSSHR